MGNNREQELASTIKRSKAPAISRAAAVLRLLGKTDSAMPLQAIARELGLVPSTCLYVLRALVDEELVAVDPDTKRYSLAAGVMTLARHWLAKDNFAQASQPHLEQITRSYGVSALGVQVFGLDHIVVVSTAVNSANFQLSAKLGSRFPALISATGRCIAAHAHCGVGELKQRFDELRWDNAPDFKQWLLEVADARENGYAMDKGHYIDGVTVFAVPVWANRQPAPSHAIVAIGIGAALQTENTTALCTALTRGAAALTEQLGGVPGAP